jgi:hypothetical protein
MNTSAHKCTNKRINKKVILIYPIILSMVSVVDILACSMARAQPNDYIRTPIVEYGEREIDFKTGVQRNRDGSSESAHSLGYGFTPTAQWATELYAKYAKSAGETIKFDAWEWENRIQLTETGKYPIDVGLLLEIERPKDRTEGYELTYGPMLQSEWGKIQANLNVFLQKHIRASAAFDTELHYQMQVKYRNATHLEWGMQAFGDVGQWNDWHKTTQQQFKIGPALFGKVKVGAKEAIKWNTALLAGTTNATPKTTLRVQTEYEF